MKYQKTYSKLLNAYPELIAKESLYKICKISKKTAIYLLENGIIPCIDTGKKTHRFIIKMIDVVEYLKQRDINPAIEKKKPSYAKPAPAIIMSASKRENIFELLDDRLKNEEDVFDFHDIERIFGYNKKYILREINCGRLKAISYKSKYIVPKVFMLEYIRDYGIQNRYIPEELKLILYKC